MIARFNWFLTRFFNFLNNKSPIFFLNTPEMGIGNTAEEIYHGFLYARRTGKKIVLLRRFSFFGRPPMANRVIFSLRSADSLGNFYKPIQFIGNCFLTLFGNHVSATLQYFGINIYRVIKFCYAFVKKEKFKFFYRRHKHLYKHIPVGRERLWLPGKTDSFSLKSAKSIDWEKQYGTYLPIFLEQKEQARAQKLLEKMGLSKSDWFACFHVREGGYYKDVNEHRNSDILNCVAAMKAITDRGGWVIRMGDRTMKRLPPMERVIDYPFTEFKSELLDLYLIQKCKIYVGQNSGIMDVAILFQKKIVLFNVTELMFVPPVFKNSIVIPKHVYSKREKRFLSVGQLLNEPPSWQQLFKPDPNYVLVENTPEEIKQAVLESLNQDEKYSYSPLQREFIRKRRLSLLPVLGDYQGKKGDSESQEKIIELYRRVGRFIHSEGTLGRDFLEKNWNDDIMNSQRDGLPLS